MIRKTPLEAWISTKIGRHAPGDRLTTMAIRAYQLDTLRETIKYARQSSPFYRNTLAGFPASQISCLEDIQRLPFTTADDIRQDPLRFLSVPQGEISRIVTLNTSGTTGNSKRLFFTQEDLELTIDFFCHGMSTLVERGDKVLILLPGDKPDSVGDLLARGLTRMDVYGLIHGPIREIAPVVKTITQERVNSLVGIPTQILALARSREGSNITKGSLKSVLLSTDYVPVAIARELARTWGCSVFNHYGMTEMGLGGGVECEALAGYHLREADLYFEVVDPTTGEPKCEGESGEIVFTTLTRKGMPLIRFRTGDIARFIPESCPCKTILRRMERVTGRWDGTVRLGSNGILRLPDLDEALFPLPWLLNYRAILSQDGKNDCLGIEAYVVPGSDPKEHQVHEALKKVPAVAEGLAMGCMTLAPVKISKQNWTTTGIAKRSIIDNRERI